MDLANVEREGSTDLYVCMSVCVTILRSSAEGRMDKPMTKAMLFNSIIVVYVLSLKEQI